jgi:hypothetical protein
MSDVDEKKTKDDRIADDAIHLSIVKRFPYKRTLTASITTRRRLAELNRFHISHAPQAPHSIEPESLE